MTAYDRDLAYIHDTGFTGFARKAAPGLLRLLRQNRIVGGRVVDAGCGSGVWARELSERGYDVLGIDISAHMIRLARRHAPAVKFQVGSFLSAVLPPCDAVTSIGECVNYVFDRRSGKRGLAEFFRRVHGALRPGACSSSTSWSQGWPQRGRRSEDSWKGPTGRFFWKYERTADARRSRGGSRASGGWGGSTGAAKRYIACTCTPDPSYLRNLAGQVSRRAYSAGTDDFDFRPRTRVSWRGNRLGTNALR